MSSVLYLWSHCPQWLFQWFIGASFYLIVCIWSLAEYIRIIIKLKHFKEGQLSQINIEQLNNNINNANGNHSLPTSDLSSNFDQCYNFEFSLKKKTNNDAQNDSLRSKSATKRMPQHSFYAKSIQIKQHNKKITLFGSRSSQKAFLIVIFFQSIFRGIEFMSIAFIKQITSDKDKNCSMSVVDSTSASTTWYIYCEVLGSLLFPMAFSCLAYQLAKIYYRFNSKSKHIIKASIFRFLYCLIAVNVVCFIGIFFLLFCIQYNDKNASDQRLEILMASLYGIVCLILSICYARFAFPIYKMYKKIKDVTSHKPSTANLILGDDKLQKKQAQTPDHSMKSAKIRYPKMSGDRSMGRAGKYHRSKQSEESTEEREESLSYNIGYDYHDISTIHEESTRCCQNFRNCLFGNGKNERGKNGLLLMDDTHATAMNMPSDAQLFYGRFVASLNRTWLTALYCGAAFFLRATVLIIPAITRWYEDNAYTHAMYFLFLEILPIFSMLYIYRNATNHIGMH